MVERGSGTNVANGILSAITLACGIIFSVLIALLFRRLFDMVTLGTSNLDAYAAYASAPVWSIGFAYMVPGLIGVIASLVGGKGGYITQMVFCILTLVIMGIFFIVGILALSAMSLYDSGSCVSVGSSCTCLNGMSSSISLGYSCDDLYALSGMAIGATVMIVLGWVVCLIATVTGGMLACSRETHPGVIVQQHGQPGVAVVQMGPMGGIQQHGGYIAQPGYGGQPGYIAQPGYVAQPGYGAQPEYSAGVVNQSYPSDGKGNM